MGILVSTIAALSTFYPGAKDISDPGDRHLQVVRLIAKIPTLAAFAYRHALGLPYNYPDGELSYTGNLLSMFWKMTEPRYQPDPVLSARAGRAVHPARRPRAELLDQRDARRSAARGSTRSPPPPRPPPPCTAPCTAARTSRCCGCCAISARWTTSRPTSTG